MTILKEREAVDYLQRARSALRPGEHHFSNIPLVAKMLDIETAFVERAMVDGPEELAQVAITAAGFPELESWQEDIQKAFRTYDRLRKENAQALLPFIRRLPNPDFDIKDEGDKALVAMRKNYPFLQAFAGLTEKQIKILKAPSLSDKVFVSSKLPGLLCVKDTLSAFIDTEKRDAVTDIPKIAGLKYIDFEPALGAPLILYTSLGEGLQTVINIRGITANIGLTGEYYDGYKKMASTHHHCNGDDNVTLTKGVHASRGGRITCEENQAYPISINAPIQKNDSQDRVFPEVDYNTIVNYVDKVSSAHQLLMRAYIDTDFTNLDSEDISAFFKLLPEIEEVIRTIQHIGVVAGEPMNDFYVAGAIDPDGFQKDKNLITEKTRTIWDSLPNDQLKATFQLMLGEIAKRSEDRLAEAIWAIDRSRKQEELKLATPESVGLKAPRRKFLGLF